MDSGRKAMPGELTRANAFRFAEIDSPIPLRHHFGMSHIISESELQAALDGLPGWLVIDGKLVKRFTFDSFREAVAGIVRVAFEVEDTNHHPEIRNSYNNVEFSLCTHDVGGEITDKDLRLAALIEKLLTPGERS